jgi:hypothetical protein
MKRIFVAGPLRADTIEQHDANIAAARAVAVEAIRRGYYPITPHLLTGGIDGQPEEFFLIGALRLVPLCDEVWLAPGWRHSLGTRAEIELAKRCCIPVLDGPEYSLAASK